MIAALERGGLRSGLPDRPRKPGTARWNRAPRPKPARICSARTRGKIDGMIVTLPNFGDERGIAETLRMAGLNVPVLIQATPDTAGQMTIADRRDSFCGKMSVCNNLKQYGIPYSLTTLHTEAPDSAEFAQGPGEVRRRLPRRQRAARLAHRRHRRAPGRVQHRPLQREDPGSQRHHGGAASTSPRSSAASSGMKDDAPEVQAKLGSASGTTSRPPASPTRRCSRWPSWAR